MPIAYVIMLVELYIIINIIISILYKKIYLIFDLTILQI